MCNHLPLLEFCSCQVNKEAASCWSSFNGKSTRSCESSSGINLSSPWRKHHRMANNSFGYDERELHIYHCQLQHRRYYVRGLMRQEGHLVDTCCMFLYIYIVFHSIFSVFSFILFLFEVCKFWVTGGVTFSSVITLVSGGFCRLLCGCVMKLLASGIFFFKLFKNKFSQNMTNLLSIINVATCFDS